MENEYNFVGRNYSDEEKQKQSEVLNEWSEASKEPLKGEQPKTEEELKMVEEVNQLLSRMFRRFGIEESPEILPEQIHLLEGESAAGQFHSDGHRGTTSITENRILINKNMLTKPQLFATMLHEAIHFVSARKFHVDDEGGFHDAKVGYRSRAPWKESGGRNLFRGFNEYLVESTNVMLLRRFAKELTEKFGITTEDIESPMYSYMHYGDIVDPILTKLMNDPDHSPAEVSQKFMRGQFTGEMMHLRNIERIYGEGALRILSLLESGRSKEENDQLEDMIHEFFTNEDAEQRKEIRDRIFEFVEEKDQEQGKG